MILLDYDGTLVDFHDDPELAQPEESLISLIKELSEIPNTDLAIVSGRDQYFLGSMVWPPLYSYGSRTWIFYEI